MEPVSLLRHGRLTADVIDHTRTLDGRQPNKFRIPLVVANDDSGGNTLQLEKRDVIAWCRPFLASEHHLAVPLHQLAPRIEDNRRVISPTVDPVDTADYSCDLAMTAGLADLFFGGGDLFSASGVYIYPLNIVADG